MIVRSIRAVVVALLLLLSVAAAVATGQTSGAPVQPPRIALEDSLDAPYEALSLIRRDAPSSFPIGVRLETALSKDSRTALDARLSEYATRGAAVWIALRAPGAREDVDAWQAELEALLQRHGRELQTVEILLDVQPTALADYIVRIGSTEIRSKHDGLLVALGGIRAAALSALYTPQLAAFVDVLAVHEDAVAAGMELVARVDPDARIVVTGMDGGSDVATARLRLLNAVLETVGTRVAAHAWKATAITSEALPVLTPISGLITGDITTLDSSAAALRLQLGADDVTPTLPHRLLFDQRTFATYLVVLGRRAVRTAFGDADAAGRGHAAGRGSPARPTAIAGGLRAKRRHWTRQRARAADRRPDARRFQRWSCAGVRRAHRRLGVAPALD